MLKKRCSMFQNTTPRVYFMLFGIEYGIIVSIPYLNTSQHKTCCISFVLLKSQQMSWVPDSTAIGGRSNHLPKNYYMFCGCVDICQLKSMLDLDNI